MKLKKYIALLLALLLVMAAVCGCAAKGKTLLEIEKEKITVNTFYLFLSRMKGYLSTANAYGENVSLDSFWDTMMSTDGTTYDDFYTDKILDNVKTYVAALHLFRERGLKLPKETVNAIDDELREIIDNEWNGSKSEFNAKLSQYGANYDVLREAKIIEAKIEYLRDDLFGTDGSQIGAGLKEDYYQQNYRRFKHLFFYTYHFVTETAEDGTEKILTDSNGNAKTEPMTETEIQLVIDRVSEAYGKAAVEGSPSFLDAWKNGKTAFGDAGKFDALLSEKDEKGKYMYNEDKGMQLYPNGIYLKSDSNYDFAEVRDAVFQMEEGEIRVIRSAHGFHIVMRYENDEGAYAVDANKDCFAGFINELEDKLLTDHLRPYKELVVVDEKAYKGISMKDVEPNLHY